MIITVLSCSKNEDTFLPFHHCLEKYWVNHPEVVYFTDGIINPYYRTIPTNHDLSHWTTGLREFLAQIDDNQIMLMIDDIFIRRPVNQKRIDYCSQNLSGNTAMFNFELSFDDSDEICIYDQFKRRKHGSAFEVSLMCGLWQKDKLLKVIARDCDPWTIELQQDNCGFDYYINCGDYIIDWGYESFQYCGIVKGKWAKEIVPFFRSEGIDIDYSKRGFVN